jgi:hemerythrin-like domain-containing protein
MTSTGPALPSLGADYTHPLELLAAFDRDIRQQCAALLRLRSRVAEFGADVAASDEARRIIDCFDRTSPHHADEEDDLFPALLEAMAGSDPVCIRELAEALTREHRAIERLWRLAREWVCGVETQAFILTDARAVDALADLCERHAAREEQELLPMAERLLGSEDLERIGRSMHRRRRAG